MMKKDNRGGNMKSILKNNFGISGKIIDFGENIYDVKPLINDIKQRARYNQIKVLSAFNEKGGITAFNRNNRLWL